MLKFIYSQDEHLRIKNPRTRLDDYYVSAMKKIEEICQIYNKEKCDYWISGGDLLDIPLVSYTLIDDFIDLIEKYNVKLKVLFGNHSMVGARVENSKNTSLAHMIRRSPNIELLSNVETSEEFIVGHDYYYGIENDINEKGLMCDKESPFKIAVIHALLTQKPFFKETNFSVIGKFKTNYDMVLVAHNHIPWGCKEIDGTVFINIGNIGRVSIGELKVDPSYLIYETGKPIRIEQLKSAKPGQEVFDMANYEEKKVFDKSIDDFINMIGNTKFQEMDIMDVIQQVAKDCKIGRDVVDCIVDKIGEIEQEKK